MSMGGMEAVEKFLYQIKLEWQRRKTRALAGGAEMKRVQREPFGIVRHIPASLSGALAQCSLCEWGRFFETQADAVLFCK